MEEVEGLVSSPTPTAAAAAGAATPNNKRGSKWAAFMIVIGIFLGILLTSDTESLRFWEGKGGENVDDVEEKEITPTLPPAFAPEPLQNAAPDSTQHPAPDPPLQPESEPIPDSDGDPTQQPAPDRTQQPAPDPTQQLAPDPTQQPAPDPSQQPASDPSQQPASDPTQQPAPDPTQQPAPDPTQQPVPDPTQQPAPDPTLQPAPDPTQQPASNPSAPPAAEKEDFNNPDIDWGAVHYPKPSLVVKPEVELPEPQKEELTKQWGKWDFTDAKASSRPATDFLSDYPNKDVPRDKFPPNAWQTDPEYLGKWIPESLKLVNRAMRAIMAEYGVETNEDDVTDNVIQQMFEFIISSDKPRAKNEIPQAFWTPPASLDGMAKRLLHALMVQDDFTFILGGHSAAAGHGNLFRQSYAMQFHKIMEPVLGILGIPLTSRNLAQGGLGTMQSSLGMRDIYGDDIDLLVWDSGMTENRDNVAFDLYWRQAIISGTNKVPFLMGVGCINELMELFTKTGVDVGNLGVVSTKLPECLDAVQCETLPYALRYMRCNAESGPLCAVNRFHSNCWVERDDVTPLEPQAEHPGSQVKWHPGFRAHQIQGRALSIFVLKALKMALTQWQQADNFALPDDAWHMSSSYENIREALSKINDTACLKQTSFPTRICTTPMHARLEFTPRAYPELTSITSTMKPDENGRVPHIPKGMLYTGPDVFNPYTAVPEGQVDVLQIVSNGRSYTSDGTRRQGRRTLESSITPGLGLEMVSYEPAGYCDGTYNAECGRQGNCLILGHQDGRGGILFDSYSGWIVMTLPEVKQGLIVTKIETWHSPLEKTMTVGWKSIDNKERQRSLLRGVQHQGSPTNITMLNHVSYYDLYREDKHLPERRHLKKAPPAFCDEFTFEFAINGDITVWNKTMWERTSTSPQRVVELQTLMDDEHFPPSQNVEVAIRMTGCGESSHKTMSLTHIYFA